MINTSSQFSLSHSNISHQQWVASLTPALAARGIRCKFDRWDGSLGLDLSKYLENSYFERSNRLNRRMITP